MATNKYTVKYNKSQNQWVVHNVNAAMRDYYPTKQDAVDYAKYRARDKHKNKGVVKVYKKNGTLQNTFNYGEGANRSNNRKSVDQIFDEVL